MQKVFRRTALASNQAKRKARKLAEKDRTERLNSIFREQTRYQRILLDDAAEERKARREDWLRGPLAPRRDVSDRYGVYGTVSTERLRFPRIPIEKRPKYQNIIPGDRVCVIKGKHEGKIGKVTAVESETQSVTIQGLNVVSSWR